MSDSSTVANVAVVQAAPVHFDRDASVAKACNQVAEEELANDGVGYLGVAVP